MKFEHTVYCNDNVVGKIELQKDGLYYSYRCFCNYTDRIIYRILYMTESAQYNLGICVPKEDHYETHGKIPIRQIGEGKGVFVALPHTLSCKCCQINAEEPFIDIELLENAKLVDLEYKKSLLITYDSM